jgi:hypothetical protein
MLTSNQFEGTGLQRTPIKPTVTSKDPHTPVSFTAEPEESYGSLRFVTVEATQPRTTDLTNYVVVLDASVTCMEGPVYGVVGEATTVKSKDRSTVRSSGKEGRIVRELVGDVIGEETYRVLKSSLYYITKAQYDTKLDGLIYRFGRTFDSAKKILYIQATGVEELDGEGIPTNLEVRPRGAEDDSKDFGMTPDIFETVSQLEYILGYGEGEPKSRDYNVRRWGLEILGNVGIARDAESLLPRSDKAPKFTIDMNKSIEFLWPNGDTKTVIPEEYLVEEVYTLDPLEASETDDEPLELRPAIKKKAASKKTKSKPKKKVKAKAKVKVKKKISFDVEDSNSESDTGAEDDDDDDIGNFTVNAPRVPTSVYNKHGINMSSQQYVQHQSVFNPSLCNGKWFDMTIEGRADTILREEGYRGVYPVTRTSTLIILCANFGVAPMSYFLPLDKVPTSAKQTLPSTSWKTNSEPVKWVETSRELVETIKVICGIANIYFRQDIAEAYNSLYVKALFWADVEMEPVGVIAYRDLYDSAMATVINAAITGVAGSQLSLLMEQHIVPGSTAYTTIISNRLTIIDGGRAWKMGTKKDGDRKKDDQGKLEKKKKALSDVEKAAVPMVDGRRVCLAFLSAKGCNRADSCPFNHADANLPAILEPYFKRRFGKRKQ